MRFFHSPALWSAHPQLRCVAWQADAIRPDLPVADAVQALHGAARERLAAVGSESELPEIQAWRRAFAAMGFKPTQVRCAAESLLRRFRKEGTLPALHPLVDLCNAASLAFAVPIAVFDLAQVQGDLVVRPADGSERYSSFSGEQEQPEPGEVIFADAAGHAHARRWCHRQAKTSAVQPGTRQVLIVAEAMHAGAEADLQRLALRLRGALAQAGAVLGRAAELTPLAPALLLDRGG